MTAPPVIRPFDPMSIELSGTRFLEASAGTGKTYALATLYLRLLVERDLRPAEILVVTFTQAATAELRDRIRSRIRDRLAETSDVAVAAKLRRALRDFDEAAIFTIHGFCQRTLQESAFESGLAFEPEIVEKPEVWQRTLAHDLWKQLLEASDPAFRAWLGHGAGRTWEFEPDTLFDWIAHRLGGDDEMKVLPERLETGAQGPIDPLVAAARDAWLAFAERWHADRQEIRAMLCSESAGLRGNLYKAVWVEESWAPELDDLARRVDAAREEGGPVILPLPSRISKSFTREALERGAKNGHLPLRHPFFDTCSVLVAAAGALDAELARRALALRRRFVDAVREAAAKRREAQHVLFFDDLLLQLRSALRGPDGETLRRTLRARYRFALIDEFQDTDAVQYEIFRTVWHDPSVEASGGGLVLIGDPKQAIYAFRGADVHTYLAARAQAKGEVHSLDVNYRSDAPVIEAVNRLFGSIARPFAVDAIDYRRVSAVPPELDRRPIHVHGAGRSTSGLRVLTLRGGGAEGEVLPVRFGRTAGMQAIAYDIVRLLDSGATIGGRRVAPSDVAILARRKRELDAARRALEAVGIPCVSRGEGNVFDAREAWELATVVSAWLAPGDPTRLRTALSSGAHGLGAAEIATLDDDSTVLAEVAERYAGYGRIWSDQGFARAFETWRAREEVTARLLAYGDGDRRLTNWLHLAELLARIENDRGASRTGLLAWLERAIADETIRLELGGDASLLRLERDDQAVSLVTLHRSKGLEYEYVYLPSLWETFEPRVRKSKSIEEGGGRPPALYHDPETGERILDLGILEGSDHADHVALEKAVAAAEHLRLLYVGLTRARRQCVVLWGRIGPRYAHSPLARLVLGPRAARDRIGESSFAGWAGKLGHAEWQAAWSEIAGEAGDAIGLEDADRTDTGRWRSSAAPSQPLVEPVARPLALRPLVTTSFSGLVRSSRRAAAVAAGPLATGRDLDAEVELRPSEPDAVPDLAAEMHLFPRGAEAGTVLHDVLERIDLGALDPVEVRRVALQEVERSPLGTDVVPKIEHVVRAVARTPLRAEPRPFRLGDVPRGRFVPELEFTLAASGESAGPGFSAEALAEVLADAPAGSPLARYADRARSLAWPTLSGYLRGFIDAVFFDGERYALLDYKSNHLGDRQRDYLPDRLVEPMIEHDYVLQYLLYTVAVDRHLASRLADYDYERHFGGAYYLFLRGLAPEHPPGCGVFFDRPDARTVRRVAALIGRGAEGRA